MSIIKVDELSGYRRLEKPEDIYLLSPPDKGTSFYDDIVKYGRFITTSESIGIVLNSYN